MKRLTLLVAIVVLVCGQASSFGDIQTGKVTPISSFSGNQTYSNYSYTISHAVASFSSVTLALISFDSLLSSAFTFNTTIFTFNGTSVVFNVQTYNLTYFNILSFHYLIEGHATLDCSNVCYYTSTLYSGSGVRAAIFNNVTTTFNGSFTLVSTVLKGFKAHNYQGTTLQLAVSSTLNGLIVETTVTVKDYTLLEWVCIGIVIYDPRSTLVGGFYLYEVGSASYSGSISALADDASYRRSNTQFFGISALNLGTSVDQNIFIMKTDIVATPLASPTINENINFLALQQLFIWTDACTSSPTNFVPLPGVGNTTCVTTCPGLQYNDTNQYCVPCGMQTGNCQTCDSTQCLSCNSASPIFRSLDTGSTPNICICMTGYFELSGVCKTCLSYMINCLTCTSQTVCTSCMTGFVPSGGICVCAPGTYLNNNGTCIPLMGCNNWFNITNAYYCTDCDSSNFFYQLANQTCACMANTVYNSVTGICDGNCSDGKALGNDCDLGAQNGVANSGCYANCTIMPGYYCTNPDANTASVCVPQTTYTGKFLYVTKDLTSNTANIYVQLSPNDAVLSEMDFSSLVTSSIPTTAIACQFNNDTGLLLIKATYSESIEGSTQLVNISFDATKQYAPNVQLYCAMNGVNAKLQFGTFQTYNSIVYYLSIFVGAGGILFSVVSAIIGYKMIGFEICLPIQVIYFTLSLLNVPYSSMSSMYGLVYSTGYNQLTSFSLLNNLDLDKGLIVLQKNNFFLENCNFTYIIVLLVMGTAMATRCFVSEKANEVKKASGDKKKDEEKKDEKDDKEPNEKEKEKDKDKPEEASRGERFYYFVVDRLLVNLWVVLLLLAVFSFAIQVQTQSYSSSYSFNLNIAVGILVFLIELGGLMFIILKIKDKDRTVTFRSYSKYYPIVYICIWTVSVLVIGCSYYATQYAIFFMIIPEIIVIIVYIKLAPHGKFKSFINITGLVCQTLPLIATSAFIVTRYIGSAMFSTVLAFAIEGLCLIAIGLSIARLVLRYRDDKNKVKHEKNNEKVRMEEQDLEAMTYSSIKNKLINDGTDRKLNWQKVQEGGKDSNLNKMSYQKVQSFQESQGEQKEPDEEDELKKLKMRLRKEIMENRSYQL